MLSFDHPVATYSHQQKFEELVGQGYRLTDVSTYAFQGRRAYAAIWEQARSGASVARHGLTSSQSQDEFDARVAEGYRLTCVTAA